jgi:hypothetical protein
MPTPKEYMGQLIVQDGIPTAYVHNIDKNNGDVTTETIKDGKEEKTIYSARVFMAMVNSGNIRLEDPKPTVSGVKKQPTSGNLADANYATPHFKMSNFDCNDGTPVPRQFYPTVMMLMQQLEIIRAACGGRRIFINSGYRTPQYNATIPGAAPSSQHLFANGADIVVEGMQPMAVYRIIEQLMDTGQITPGGLGIYNGHVHYDQRGNKTTWDAR